MKDKGWRNGSMVKSTYCSCRKPGFDFQHLSSSSQPPVTQVPETLLPSSGLHRCNHMVHIHSFIQANTHTQKNKYIKKRKKRKKRKERKKGRTAPAPKQSVLLNTWQRNYRLWVTDEHSMCPSLAWRQTCKQQTHAEVEEPSLQETLMHCR